MRRLSRVLGVAILAGAVLGVAPAPGADAAGTASLTVRTLDRTGHLAATQVLLENRSDFSLRYVDSGHATKLPKGSYDALVDIFDQHDQSDTLAMTRVSLTGTKTVTVDARRGHRVRIGLTPAPPAGYQQTFLTNVCQSDGPAFAEGFTYGTALYVVPTSLPEAGVAVTSTWRNGSAPQYVVTATAHHGLPAGISRTVRQSSLATLTMSARSGPVSGLDDIDLRGQDNGACSGGTQDIDLTGSLPFTFVAHVSPGKWQMAARGQEYASSALHTYRGAHSYHVTINRASWGPQGQLPYTWDGGRIYLATESMFTDSSLPQDTEADTSTTLTRNGKVVLRHSTRGEGWGENVRIPGSGWYTVTTSAKRHPRHALAANALSIRSSVVQHFYADLSRPTQTRGYLTLFRPQGLTAHNVAHPGSRTTVLLPLQRQRPTDGQVRQLTDSVRSVRLLYTVDGGAHWHASTVHRSGSSYSAVIANPRSGYLGLKATVTDTHGGYTTTAVLRAYGID